MGAVKFEKSGVGEVIIIKKWGGENLNVKIGSGQAANVYDPTYRQCPRSCISLKGFRDANHI